MLSDRTELAFVTFSLSGASVLGDGPVCGQRQRYSWWAKLAARSTRSRQARERRIWAVRLFFRFLIIGALMSLHLSSHWCGELIFKAIPTHCFNSGLVLRQGCVRTVTASL